MAVYDQLPEIELETRVQNGDGSANQVHFPSPIVGARFETRRVVGKLETRKVLLKEILNGWTMNDPNPFPNLYFVFVCNAYKAYAYAEPNTRRERPSLESTKKQMHATVMRMEHRFPSSFTKRVSGDKLRTAIAGLLREHLNTYGSPTLLKPWLTSPDVPADLLRILVNAYMKTQPAAARTAAKALAKIELE